MLENQLSDEVAVDRRTDSVQTERPGYQSTQQVTLDVAGERRLKLFQINRILFMVIGILDLTLALRFILKLLGANPSNGFASLVYGLTGTFTQPFDNLLGPPVIDGPTFETTTLLAICVYAFIWGMVAQVILLIGNQPRVRSVTRSVQEHIPGNEAAMSVAQIEPMDPLRILNPSTPSIAAASLPKEPLHHAYIKFIRRRQHLITLKARQASARFKMSLMPSTVKLIQIDPVGAESINTEQLPGDPRLDQIDRTDPAERINVEQLPGDISLDQIVRTNPAESINVEQLPGDISLDQIKPTDRPRIIRIVKSPPEVEANREDPLLRSYREFVQRHQRTGGLAESKTSPN